MEETPEGLAAARVVRESAKRKREPSPTQEGQGDAQKRSHPLLTACTHDVAVPKDYAPSLNKLDEAVYGTLESPHFTGAMHKTYPYTLDPFQAISVACIERNESVMVAAHTSAGKTTVAEYAIAKCFASNQRVVYTSPLKALSNQKFRELSEEFGDVGIMTGDVSINPEAQCVVMTTEILRSMIYRGGELLREVAWVIFDEVHYMKDRERGVVWEESIIFMPPNARMAFLSATLSNSREFADWVATLHSRPCHVVYTDVRPTPLAHFAFLEGGDGLHCVCDQHGNFKTTIWDEAAASAAASAAVNGGSMALEGLAPAKGKAAPQGGAQKGAGEGKKKKGGRAAPPDDVVAVVALLKQQQCEPVIVFSFSRRECEQLALTLSKGELDSNTDDDKETVGAVFDQAISVLREEDRQLQAIQQMRPILLRGIGVHHSGLLPILKELVEILFQEGHIKVLFATETFAMGLNMPAKTVVFTNMTKWDGTQSRFMESGEYIQMSGRAGRRGKDDRGLAVMMIDHEMTQEIAHGIVKGKASPLLSSFKLSYFTLLNMLRRVEGGVHSMEYVISHSFQQHQFEAALPKVRGRIAEIEAELAAGDTTPEALASLTEYDKLREQLAEQEDIIRGCVMQPDRALHFLATGRLLKVREGATDWGWGVAVHTCRGSAPGGGAANYSIDTLLVCSGRSLNSDVPKPTAPDDPDAQMVVIPTPLDLITAISSLRVSVPVDLISDGNRAAVLMAVRDLLKRFPDGPPLLDPITDMRIDDPELTQAIKATTKLETSLAANAHFQLRDRGRASPEQMRALEAQAALAAEAAACRERMKSSQIAEYRREVKARTGVLRRLGHVDGDGVVQIKGRAACEIDSADELLTTELMFNGVFKGLDKHQLVALVSCLVPVGEKIEEEIALTRSLAAPLAALQETARFIAEVQLEASLEVNTEEYEQSFQPVLMDVIYAWSKGASFSEVCQQTPMFEGSIIRATRRLDELMHQLQKACEAVGEMELAQLFADSVATIRRDIMFAASLYI